MKFPSDYTLFYHLVGLNVAGHIFHISKHLNFVGGVVCLFCFVLQRGILEGSKMALSDWKLDLGRS